MFESAILYMEISVYLYIYINALFWTQVNMKGGATIPWHCDGSDDTSKIKHAWKHAKIMAGWSEVAWNTHICKISLGYVPCDHIAFHACVHIDPPHFHSALQV